MLKQYIPQQIYTLAYQWLSPIIMIIQRIVTKLRNKYFPSEHDLMVRKWWADGGDYELRFDYNLNEESLVLDLGGYEGQWASDLYSRYRCNIYVFEPVGSFAKRIKERFHKNSQIEVFQYGLGGSSRAETIHICADGSSLFRNSHDCEEINIIDIKEWIEGKGFKQINLIKINIEGGEYELLERLIATHLIEMIDNIQVQFHNISDNSCSRMERIQQELRKTHRPIYQYKFVWENWTRKNNSNLLIGQEL